MRWQLFVLLGVLVLVQAPRGAAGRSRAAAGAAAAVITDSAGQATAGVWVLTDTWTSSYSTTRPTQYGKASLSATTATLTSTAGETTYRWSEPPRTIAPGETISVSLSIGKEEGTLGRAYALVFFGTETSGDQADKSARGSKGEKGSKRDKTAPTGVMIPPELDLAGIRPDEGPLFEGQPVTFQVRRGGRTATIAARLQGKLFLEPNDSGASSTWSGAVPAPSTDGRFILIISLGHALREVPEEARAGAVESTQSVAGAKYYEYAIKQ
jgi:hypothetical protein